MIFDAEAQNVALKDIIVNGMKLSPVNCDLKAKWGEGDLIKTRNGDNDQYTLVFESRVYDSIERLIERFIETNNSYLDYIIIKNPKHQLLANQISENVGMEIEKLRIYFPAVLSDYNNLKATKIRNTLQEIVVGIQLLIDNPFEDGTYLGGIPFGVQNGIVSYIQIDLRSEGDFD